ncbi:GNAT family N-acetyltransferase [Mucilaginibacter ginkgonis]|uniref:GNAT family N-acetyltransferase n=1 Tax=Mucilaginibacter ginkgonis TaxID=2682091 RepID=A0A7T7JGL0_9SPHI|nr:GNAT family N-acetyltransferase [Mucilaginibacter ginkgonis]QQL49346.1 GNAT family N-acetyltransferase [Mucilaginibacter ginkgonis]
MAIIFETERFIIREYLPADLDDFVRLLTDPEVKVYLPQRSREEWSTIFNANLDFYKSNPGLGRWGVEDKRTGKLVANAMLLPSRESLEGHEVGYSLEKFYGETAPGLR